MIRLTNVTINELHNHHTITSVNSVTLAKIHAKVNRMFFDILPVVRYDTAGFFVLRGLLVKRAGGCQSGASRYKNMSETGECKRGK